MYSIQQRGLSASSWSLRLKQNQPPRLKRPEETPEGLPSRLPDLLPGLLCSRSGLEKLSGIEALSISPQSFQVIIRPGIFREDMDYQIQVVHQDPLSVAIPLDMLRTNSLVLQSFLDFVDNGLNLA